MITSMNSNELYKTLVGHYKPNYHSAAGNNEPVKTVRAVTAIPENAVKLNDMPVYKDISDEPQTDRFVFSDSKVFQNQDIGLSGNNEIKEMPYEASDAIDFMCNNIRTELQSGYANGLVTKERIAEYYGNMARRLDEAYTEGKFTKGEYDELNEMIENQIEKEITLTENKNAFYALNKKRYSLSPAAAKEVIVREQSMTPEELFSERQKMINDYAAKYCKIDRAALMKLFNSIRYNK